MEIREINSKEWANFHKGFPYHTIPSADLEFQKDCVLHCSPTERWTTIGAFLEGQLVGLLNFNHTFFNLKKEGDSRSAWLGDDTGTPVLYVNSMIVLPEHRRKGISKTLLERVEQYKKEEEKHILLFPVSKECVALTDKLGFRFDDEIWVQQEDVVKDLV